VLFADWPVNQLAEGFHGRLCDALLGTVYQKNLYLLPRNSFKTTIITCARNVQRILNHPDIRILIASNKLENAADMLSGIKAMLQHPLMIWAFPDILWADPAKQAEKWTEGAISVKRKRGRGNTVEVIGEGGELTSKHFHHITMDDVVGRENSQTREMLGNTIQFVRLAMSLVDDPKTSTIDYIGTPWHYADAYAWLREQKARHGMLLGEYITPCWRPATPEEPGAVDSDAVAAALGLAAPGFGWVVPSFPERLDVPTLLRTRAEKGPSEFAAQYLLDPVSADTVVFSRTKIERVKRSAVPAGLWTVMTVDPAISDKKWADYSALAVVGWDRENQMWVQDLRQGRWSESRLIEEVYAAVNRHPGIMAVGFEAISFAKLFQPLFAAEGEKRGHVLPLLKLPRETRQTKNVRIRMLEPPWAARQIKVVEDCPALEELLYDAERWRPDAENARDDLLDALADSWQLRSRPNLVLAPDAQRLLDEDPVRYQRAQWEQSLRATRPRLDRAEVEMAWLFEQRAQDRQQEPAATGDWWRVG
jgi:hypothetical protein